MRYRLRTLLAIFLIVAAVLGVPAWWDYLFQAQVTHLTDAQAARLQLYGPSDIRVAEDLEPDDDNRFIARYRPGRRGISALLSYQEKGLTNYNARYVCDEAVVHSEAKQTIERMFASFEAGDTPQPNSATVVGIVVDAADRPLPGVMVDLVGSYAHINFCQTRDDGTFFMSIPLSTPEIRSRLRIRAFQDREWSYRTARVRIASGERRQLQVKLPAEVAPTEPPEGDP